MRTSELFLFRFPALDAWATGVGSELQVESSSTCKNQCFISNRVVKEHAKWQIGKWVGMTIKHWCLSQETSFSHNVCLYTWNAKLFSLPHRWCRSRRGGFGFWPVSWLLRWWLVSVEKIKNACLC